MLEQIRKSALFKSANLCLLLAGACLLSSCAATKETPQIVSSGEPESQLPWNEQQKWEGTGQFGPMAERMEGR